MLTNIIMRQGTMAAGKFRLKGRPIMELGRGIENPHQVHLRSQVSWPTVSKYLSEDPATLDEMRSVDLEVLYGLLVDGFGLSEHEALNLRLGDLFDVSRKRAAE
jgi:hypothetical protein